MAGVSPVRYCQAKGLYVDCFPAFRSCIWDNRRMVWLWEASIRTFNEYPSDQLFHTNEKQFIRTRNSSERRTPELALFNLLRSLGRSLLRGALFVKN